MITMPVLEQSPSPNYSPTLIDHDLFIFHLEEGAGPGSLAWLCSPAAKASSHLVGLDPAGSKVAQLVPLQFKAWAQCAFNSKGLSLEMPGFTERGVPDATLDAMGKIGAWCMLAYGIPFTWAKGGQGRGYCTHHDLGEAGGGHVDICGVGDATFEKLVAALAKWRSAFLAAGPLPAWALHGLPNPRAVSMPSSATLEPSHGGASRAEPGDTHAHPTASSFPEGSIADLQWRLNKIGVARPALSIDGRWGPETSNAVALFQGQAGIYVDGMIGPKTWTALQKVA